MIVIRHWRRVENVRPKAKGEEFRRVHIYKGWFLFGIIPLFINRDTEWTVLQ